MWPSLSPRRENAPVLVHRHALTLPAVRSSRRRSLCAAGVSGLEFPCFLLLPRGRLVSESTRLDLALTAAADPHGGRITLNGLANLPRD